MTARILWLAAPLVVACVPASATRLDPSHLTVVDGSAATERYRGRVAVRLSPPPGHENDDGDVVAIVPTAPFKNGVIELDVAGAPRPGASPVMKGFIGVMFRASPASGAGELVYLRPVNGRSPSQLERNHSTQYSSPPDFGWKRLRGESAGVYESYVDLEPGAWTHVRIEVVGTQAKLFVGGGRQPCLVVNDLRRGESEGAIALWAHHTTLAYFADLVVTPEGRTR